MRKDVAEVNVVYGVQLLELLPMISRQDLFLGRLHFTVESSRPLYDVMSDEDLYDPFRSAAVGLPVRHICPVTIVDTPSEALSDAELLFDSSPAWKLYQCANDVRMILRTSALDGSHEEPIWQARIAPAFEAVEVHVGEKMRVSGDVGFGFANPLCYPLDQLLLLHLLAEVDMLLVHGACVDFGSGAVVYAGCSGAGKTTLSRLIASCEELECDIITDDRVLLARTECGWLAGGTPWPGEGRYAMNEWRPLRAVNFLKQGVTERFIPLGHSSTLASMLPLMSVPWFDIGRTTLLLKLCEELIQQIPCAEFVFQNAPESVRAAVDFAHQFTSAGVVSSHVEEDAACAK